MIVRHYMTPHPWVATPASTCLEAAAIMEDRNCGMVPIVRAVDDRAVLGVVTDRDLFLALCRQGCAPGELVLGAVKTRQPITCTPDATLNEAAAKMRRNKIRRLLVTDEGGRLVGVLSLADLARACLEEQSLSDSELAEVLEALSR